MIKAIPNFETADMTEVNLADMQLRKKSSSRSPTTGQQRMCVICKTMVEWREDDQGYKQLYR